MDVILDIIDAIVDGLVAHILQPFVTDGMYRRGFLTALLVGFVLNKLISAILSARALILGFFLPSPLPATRPGPSGADKAKGCGSGVLRLIFVAIVLLVIAVIIGIGLFR